MTTWVLRPTGTASCELGHQWPVRLTWSPVTVTIDGEPHTVPNTWTFEAEPAWCARCFEVRHKAVRFAGVVCCDEEAPAAAPDGSAS